MTYNSRSRQSRINSGEGLVKVFAVVLIVWSLIWVAIFLTTLTILVSAAF